MIRVVHLIPEDGIGGVEIAAHSVEAKDTQDIDFRLVPIAPPRGGSLNPLNHLAALRDLLRRPPDVLVFSLWKTVPVAMLFRLLHRRTQLVFTANCDSTFHAVDRLMGKLGVVAADQLWGDSRASLEARDPRRTKPQRILSFIVDRPGVTERAEAGPHFVFWGRLSQQKGLDRAIVLIALLRDRGITAKFDIWGPDGGEKARLAAMIASHGLHDRVGLCGPIDRTELPGIARQASFFLTPSRTEGMAMACVEAMQLGLVPVVTPVGAMRDYVVAGTNGLHVDPANLGAAADALAALLADPPTIDRMSAAATRQWSSAPLYADDFVAACRALADERAAPLPTRRARR